MSIGRKNHWLVIAACVVLAACGETPDDTDDAGAPGDDAQVDAQVELDASTPMDDAGGHPPDTGAPDPDGGVPDGDGDGVPTSVDCDDADPAVGSTATRSCSSACGVGLERCTDGAWGACDAPTECACDTPGAMRSVPCGRCGIASQRCQDDHTWSMPSTCFGEAECFDGEIERSVVRCGESARICDATCHWRPWMEITPPGECEAGATMWTLEGCPESQTRELTCSATCAWAETTACATRCTRPPASSRTGADPICIPAGPFYLGTNDAPTDPEVRPERRVVLSDFYIDRFPVTKARYEMCRAAGACPGPDAAFASLYDAAPADAAPIYIPLYAAEMFCAWDGGTLQTEFQYEKAARGPSPDRRLHAWGTDPADLCTVHPATACPATVFPLTEASFPAAVSPYGLRLIGSLMEWTRTPASTASGGHAWIPDGAMDPEPSSTAATRIVRGWHWYSSGRVVPSNFSALERNVRGAPHPNASFRCVY